MSMKYFVMLSWIFAFRKVWAASDEGYNDVDVDDVIGEKEEEKEGGQEKQGGEGEEEEKQGGEGEEEEE